MEGALLTQQGLGLDVEELAVAVVADVDHDGELDFAIANGSTRELEVFVGDGTGDFTWSFARSFETDGLAREWAKWAVAEGRDAAMDIHEKLSG